MYSLLASQKVQKFLEKQDASIKDSIIKRLRHLETNPVPSDSKFITRHEGEKVFRYRIGDYRALYKVKEQEKTILIVKIDKRPRIYNR